MKNQILLGLLIVVGASSCVSKKKFVAMEENYLRTQNSLTKTTFEKEQLESKFAQIEAKVSAYNDKIASLTDANTTLSNENANKLSILPAGDMVVSKADISNMNNTLAKMDPSEVAEAKTLKDSMSLAVSHNLSNSVEGLDTNDDVDIKVDETVVMITVSDKLLFNSGSFRVNSKAYPLLEKLANVIKSEPSMDVMIEGHTDSRTIRTDVLEDNWDLSVKRATSIIRLLQNKYDVAPEQLIASGRSSYMPLTDNTTKENRAKNRRTRIVILPNLGKFFSMMASN
ncbi:OmpA/MotB family protein [Aquimarina agarilytica]|uniref:OmpA/MotB family protein n=1 Tax=Aquimarina agarilytica TaxID=1087449 RepID=UPI0002889C80|nr:OmpA family protein [Aquimarina agarilytica]